jgi:hypothetical protein
MLRLFLFFSFLLAASSVTSATTNRGTVHAVSKAKYSRAHSLADNYQFDPRDGWEQVNVTNLQYKYARSYAPNSDQLVEKRRKKASSQSEKKKKPAHHGKTLGGTVKHILGDVWNGLKALGQPEPVTITWYVCTIVLLDMALTIEQVYRTRFAQSKLLEQR